MKFFNLSVFTFFFTFFSNAQIQSESDYVQILGIVQDAGYPHIGCEKDCCELVVSEFKYEGSILNLSLKLSKIKPFKLLRTFS